MWGTCLCALCFFLKQSLALNKSDKRREEIRVEKWMRLFGVSLLFSVLWLTTADAKDRTVTLYSLNHLQSQLLPIEVGEQKVRRFLGGQKFSVWLKVVAAIPCADYTTVSRHGLRKACTYIRVISKDDLISIRLSQQSYQAEEDASKTLSC